MKEASVLARYRFGWLLNAVLHWRELAIAGAALLLTAARLLGYEHTPWPTLVVLDTVVLFGLLLRHLWLTHRLRRKVGQLNSQVLDVELTTAGVRFRMPDGSVRLGSWSGYTGTRVGRRVLLLYYRADQGFRKARYFPIPIHMLSRGDRTALLQSIPETLRGPAIRKELAQWRLG